MNNPESSKALPLIMIVDDEPNNLQLMRQILKNDYHLAFAASGKLALEISQKLKLDLILLDIMMPEMDGYEVCRIIKSHEQTKAVPIIFVTAKDKAHDETHGLELGAIDYITKPICPSIVKARIKNHLELKFALEREEQHKKKLEEQNSALIEAANLKEHVERIMRHDMRSPLASIVGLTQIMINDSRMSPENQKQYLQLIEESGFKLLDMLNLSLNLYKMEQGTYQFVPKQVNVIQTIIKPLNQLLKLMEIKKISLVTIANGTPLNDNSELMIQGEELLCYSMFMNLIKNAMEAAPDQSSITINCEETGQYTKIAIHNKGAVPENIRTKFFDKYITSGKYGGTGLGTYSAKLMAKTQGGTITLDTAEQNSTTVTVTLKRWA